MRISLGIVAVATLALVGCSDAPTAERVLRQQNYKDIRITGYSWSGCSRDDDFATGFIARAPNGEMVEGVVCSGWFKGATVRTF